MRATSKALLLEEKAGISPVGIKKLSTGCDPETFLEKAGGYTRSRVSFFMNRFRKLGFIDYRGGDALQVHNSLLNIVLQD